MIAYISKMIAEFLMNLANEEPDPEQLEVYIYGLECFLNAAITTVILLLLGLLTHTLPYTISWMISFALLRQHLGGYHAPTQFLCITSSACFGALTVLLVQKPYDLLRYRMLLFPICLIFCLLWAPIDTGKIEMTPQICQREKFFSLFLLICYWFLTNLLPENYAVVLLYTALLAVILMIPTKISIHKDNSR